MNKHTSHTATHVRMSRISTYIIPRFEAFVRDCQPPQGDRPIQIRYFNDVVCLFLKTFSKFYSQDELTPEDKANLRRYLEKMIEAKEAISGSLKL